MKKLVSLLMLVGLIALVAMPVSRAYAQSATNAPWTSSITYYTPSDTGGTMAIDYYAEGSGTSADTVNVTLGAHQAGSVFIGTTSVPAGFEGGAVISSDVPVIATNVQFAGNGQAGQYGRLLYSGFSADQAATNFFVPTVLYQRFGSTSMIGIQNVETTSIQATLKVYAAGSTTPSATETYTIPGQSSQVVSASELGLSAGFSGSATVEATGRVVAVAQETDDNGRGAYAFEGVAAGANEVYMASMICNAFGGQNSFYAIQNASLTDSASVSIEFFDTAGNTVATMPSTSLGAGAKISINPCNEGVPAGTSGSAVISSTGAPVVAIGKVKAPNGIATSFVGDSSGATNVAMPYIRWAADPFSEFRSFVAVMNVGGAPATNVQATYYDADGNATTVDLATAGSPLDPFIKVNTNPSVVNGGGDFGTAGTAAGVGGALEITSDQPVVVVVRLTRSVSLGSTTKFGEDYQATPFTP